MVTKLPPGSFFGRTTGRRAFAGVTVVESAYPGGACLPPHEHATAFFDLVVAGACEEVLGGQTRDRGRSTFAFHPAGEVHSSRWQGPEARCFHVEVAPPLLDRARQYSPGLDRPVHFPGGAPRGLATRLYDEFRRADDVSPLAIEGLTLELLAECSRRAPRVADRQPPRWLRTVHDLVRARFCERLTLGIVAESVGVHPAHLARVFRRFHGCTLGDHVRQLRIEFACRRLTTSDAPLAEVALAAGFSDQSHFSNTFKRHTGVPPAAFRKSARPRNGGPSGCSHRARPE
jgi:AraC family transcriptional regulator